MIIDTHKLFIICTTKDNEDIDVLIKFQNDAKKV